jgi:hypothetical protein
MPEAPAELRRHGVVNAGGAECGPLRVDRAKAVVALGRGAGPELVGRHRVGDSR